MTTFFICLALLVGSYFIYGRFLEKVANIDGDAKVPSETCYDGVDYVPLPRWRIFLIQLLNIAGTGPIFGAILGACYGPVAFIWITVGGIFIGAMHDFLAGVISVRNNGYTLPETIGKYLGRGTRGLAVAFIPMLMLLVGGVFIVTPSNILTGMTGVPYEVWLGVIIVYYFVAAILPINKIIAKVYPIFGAALIFMVVALFGVLLFGDYEVPELTSMDNIHSKAATLPLIPTLCISIACGAISGFHATQSPLMARCIKSEKQCRSVFFGAMITESVIALIWAAVAMAFFGGVEGLNGALAAVKNDAGTIVSTITSNTLGVVGSILALLGLVAAPITSGDTAFRSARLIIADTFHIDQRSLYKRLLVSIPLFAIGVSIAFIDFDVIWRYFAWSNQALSVLVLWMITSWLYRRRSKVSFIALLPAIFMTYICTSFIFISNQFVGLGACDIAYIYGGIVTALITGLVIVKIRRDIRNEAEL